MKVLDLIVAILLIVGGLNWGLVGLFGFNVVEFLFGQLPMLTKLVYVAVGAAAVYKIFRWSCHEHCCK